MKLEGSINCFTSEFYRGVDAIKLTGKDVTYITTDKRGRIGHYNKKLFQDMAKAIGLGLTDTTKP